MQDDRPAEPANRYCQRLGIPVPDLGAAVRYPMVGISDLMTLAVLGAGRPLSLNEIAARLARLDLPPRLAQAADPASLRKAWRGQGPLYRDGVNDLFYPDLLSHDELSHLAFAGDPERQATVLREPAEVRQPPDMQPLSQEEVDAALEDRDFGPYSSTLSSLRRAAAILDVAGGGPLPLDEVNSRLAHFGPSAGLDEKTAKAWRGRLVRLTDDGALLLDASSPDLGATRRDVRRLARPRLREGAWAAGHHAKQAELAAQRAARERQHMDEARRTRRALLHVVVLEGVREPPPWSTPRAASCAPSRAAP